MKYALDFAPSAVVLEHYSQTSTSRPVLHTLPQAGRLLDLWRGDDQGHPNDLLQAEYVRAISARGQAVMVRGADLYDAFLDDTGSDQLPTLIFPALYTYKHLAQVVRLEAATTYMPDVAESRGFPRHGVRKASAWLDPSQNAMFIAATDVTIRGFASGAITPAQISIRIDHGSAGDVEVIPDSIGKWGIGTWELPWRFFAPGQVLVELLIDGTVSTRTEISVS